MSKLIRPSCKKRHIIFGPPGTGKTTKLLNILEDEIADGTSPNRIAFVSFTRKAIHEAIDRIIVRFKLNKMDLIYFKTLHALAYQQLGITKNDVLGYLHLKELGRQLGLKIVAKIDTSEGLPPAGSDLGSKYLFISQLARAKMISLKEAWGFVNDHDVFYPDVERFNKSYISYKEDNAVIDFTDMIETYFREGEAPNIDVLIVDEAQDLFPLQWEVIKKLEKKAKRVYVAGDDDQCQPGYTMIETIKGPKTLASLNPKTDKLLSYSKSDSEIYGKRNGGYSFKKKKRIYKELFYSFMIDDNPQNILDATINHKWLVKWTPEAKKSKIRVVYIMRQGLRFRVGHCQLFNDEGSLHLWTRARLEKADDIWILKAFNNSKDSYIYEQIISVKYGILQTQFEPMKGALYLTKKVIDKVFTNCPMPRIGDCLKDHNLSGSYPFRTKAQVNQRGSIIMELASCNILPDLMMVPVYTGTKKPIWKPVTNVEVYTEPQSVYSLDVEKYHTYIGNGVITCNSIYNWSGGDVKIFLNLKGTKEILNQTYRLPKKIFNLANQISSKIKIRQKKEWRSIGSDGDVSYLNDPLKLDFHDKKSWFLLARNVYLLERWVAIAKAQGVVYTLRNTSSVKPDEAAAIMSWEQLRKGKTLDIEAIRNVYQFLRSKTSIKRGHKKLNNVDKNAYNIKELMKDHGLLVDDPWFDALTMIPEDQRLYYRAVLARKEGLFNAPRIHINTIHGVKGGEADHVALLTDMAYRSYKALTENPDDEHRCFYVGVTRAKEKVFIIQPESRFYYQI